MNQVLRRFECLSHIRSPDKMIKKMSLLKFEMAQAWAAVGVEVLPARLVPDCKLRD